MKDLWIDIYGALTTEYEACVKDLLCTLERDSDLDGIEYDTGMPFEAYRVAALAPFLAPDDVVPSDTHYAVFAGGAAYPLNDISVIRELSFSDRVTL